jgi:hypothetical protein
MEPPMAARVYTASGTTVSIAPSVTAEPANATAYGALTWTAIDAVETIGEIGDQAGVVTGAVLGDGRVRKGKSASDAGDLTLTCFHNPEDAGQAAMLAAAAPGNNVNYPFKITISNKLSGAGTNEIQYFIGLVTSARVNIGGNDNLVRISFATSVNSKITQVAPT